jgi:hypothetical protein
LIEKGDQQRMSNQAGGVRASGKTAVMGACINELSTPLHQMSDCHLARQGR